MNELTKNLDKLFDAAWRENIDGRGTDLTRMITTFVPDAIQELQAHKDLFSDLEYLCRYAIKELNLRCFEPGDIVRHFKYETISEEDKKQNKYLYCIKGTAEHTESGETLILYQALYSPFKSYARPLNMFYEEVDHTKYPNIKQKFRFEKQEVR